MRSIEQLVVASGTAFLTLQSLKLASKSDRCMWAQDLVMAVLLDVRQLLYYLRCASVASQEGIEATDLEGAPLAHLLSSSSAALKEVAQWRQEASEAAAEATQLHTRLAAEARQVHAPPASLVFS